MLTFDQYTLGETDTELSLETREDNRLATLTMARQCRRGINIVNRDLDPAVYDDADVIEAIRQMVLEYRRSRVRIIVFEPRQIVQRGHQLLRLSQDLTSFIEIRRGGRQHEQYSEAMFIADDCGFIHRQIHSRYEASACFNSRRRCQALLNDFEIMWTAAVPDSNLRRIRI